MKFRTVLIGSPERTSAHIVFTREGSENAVDIVYLPRDWIASYGVAAAQRATRTLNEILAGLEPKGETEEDRFARMEPTFLASLGCPTGDCPHDDEQECQRATWAELRQRARGME